MLNIDTSFSKQGDAGAHAPGNLLPGPGEAGLASAIVPTHDRAGLVLDALDCLAAQTYTRLQVVVVDDGSTDNTPEVVEHWAHRHPAARFSFVRQDNRGVAAARNAGLPLATGEFVFFLDSDDLIDPPALERLVLALNGSPEIPFAVTHVRTVGLDGKAVLSDQSGWARLSPDNIYYNHWSTNAVLFRRSTLQRSGPFHEGLRYGEDTELNWRIVVACGTGIMVDEILCTRRHHDARHLSLQGGAQDNVASAIEAKETFANWLAQQDFPPQAMRLSNLASIAGLGLRDGLAGHWPLKDRAFALLGRLSHGTGPVNALLRAAGRARSQLYYRLLFAGFKLLKTLRLAAILLKRGGSAS